VIEKIGIIEILLSFRVTGNSRVTGFSHFGLPMTLWIGLPIGTPIGGLRGSPGF
jgi:hypothetical protein